MKLGLIDRLFNIKLQKGFLLSFLIYFVIINVIFIIMYYKININRDIFMVMFITNHLDLIIILLLFFNIRKYKKLYKLKIEELKMKDKEIIIRCKYNFSTELCKYTPGEEYKIKHFGLNYYTIEPLNENNFSKFSKYNIFIDEFVIFENYINKFEIITLKGERRKKLQNIKKLW